MTDEIERFSPLEMNPEQFRELGHKLVDQIAEFLAVLPHGPVTTGEPPSRIKALLGSASGLPQSGSDPGELLGETAKLLFEHSLFNGHPKFWGYITSSAAPIGMLADLLAAAVNPNCGAWNLSPVATEIELQTVQWIAELLRYPKDCGGVLVSGGNMANFVCFLAARQAKCGWDIRKEGFDRTGGRMRVYASAQAHTWLHKAADMFGLGTNSVRWIATDAELRIDPSALRKQIEADLEQGESPFLVIGTAGSVGTGCIDPLPELAAICKEFDLWFHVDGAYGAFAAIVPDAPLPLRELHDADSIAVDPHKWLYAPLEAGCALVKNAQTLRDAFTYHPEYYKFDKVAGEEPTSLVDYGPQNSRGFRALKVWLALKQVGRSGYEKMIAEDIRLARKLYDLGDASQELEAVSHSLSITTFRYVPRQMPQDGNDAEAYLNELNSEILTRLQEGGEAFVSNAVVSGKYVLRACIVNFRTSAADVEALPGIIIRLGRQLLEER